MTRIDDDLAPLASTDPFVQRAVETMLPLLQGTDAASRLSDISLYIVDFRFAPTPIRKGRYYTDNCSALLDEQAIVINQGYLLEAEAAMRSFGLPGELLDTPYLRSEEDMFGLVERIRPDPARYVDRLRALDRLPGREIGDQEAVDGFAMLLMFLIGHELGHLDAGHDQRAFGAYVDPDEGLEAHVGNAVVKLTRHARELADLGFDLPGLNQVINESGEVGANEKTWRDTHQDTYSNHDHWFADEARADRYATVLVQQVLDQVAADDSSRSDYFFSSVVRALFAVALYFWQRDLGEFLHKLGIARLSNTKDLVFAMMIGRQPYLYGAALFGEVHRFTLLRSILAIDGWMHARGLKDEPLDEAVQRLEPLTDRPDMEQSTTRDCLQREFLLRIHIDTANKIAHVGSMSGWILENDIERGTAQIFVMNFEPIDRSVDRLKKLF